MSEVRTKVEWIIRVKENRQIVARNAAIAVAQNNVQSNFPKYQETKKKPEEKRQQFGGRPE